MNGSWLCLALLMLGTDYGWQRTSTGELEYIIQIEPELLDTLRGGEEIVSELPAELRNVRRFRIRVGNGPLPRDGLTPPADRGNRAPSLKLDDLPPPPGSGLVPDPTGRADGPGRVAEGAAADASRFIPPQFDRRPGAAAQVGDDDPPPPLYSPPASGGAFQPPSGVGRDTLPLTPPAGTTQFPPPPGYGGFQPPGTGDNSSQPSVEPIPAKAGELRPIPQAGGSGQPNPLPEFPANAAPLHHDTQPAVYNEQVGDANTKAAKKPPATDSATPTPRPWMPLLITSFALFASIGVNIYLGWIAIGAYQRYQNLARDMQLSSQA